MKKKGISATWTKVKRTYETPYIPAPMMRTFSAEFEFDSFKKTCEVKHQTKLFILATTTCQDHAVKFMATEQLLLIEIYGYSKHLITKMVK